MPVTTPEVLTVPTEGVTLLQIPPPAASVKDVLAPTQVVGVPVIVPGFGSPLTVTTSVVVHPVEPLVKVIAAVPAATPVTTPPGLVTVATAVLLLVQLTVPPVVSASVVVPPTHSTGPPVIVPTGVTLTVVLPVAVTPHTSVIVRL